MIEAREVVTSAFVTKRSRDEPPRRRLFRRHCDSPARTGARSKSSRASPGRTRSDLGDSSSACEFAAHRIWSKHGRRNAHAGDRPPGRPAGSSATLASPSRSGRVPATGDDSAGFRPDQQQGRRRRRWLLGHASESQVRFAGAPSDLAGSKHTGDTRKRGKAGPSDGSLTAFGGRRRSQSGKWRNAGTAQLCDESPALRVTRDPAIAIAPQHALRTWIWQWLS